MAEQATRGEGFDDDAAKGFWLDGAMDDHVTGLHDRGHVAAVPEPVHPTREALLCGKSSQLFGKLPVGFGEQCVADNDDMNVSQPFVLNRFE